MASGSESESGPAAVAAGSGGIAIISVDGGGAPELTVRTPDADAGALGSETCLEKKSWKACMASHPERIEQIRRHDVERDLMPGNVLGELPRMERIRAKARGP